MKWSATVDAGEHRDERRSGPVLMGALLVAIGLALLLDRAGLLTGTWRVALWPMLLIAFGAARLTQQTRHGRDGLFFVLAGLWWLGGVAGLVSLRATWPLLVVALGASVLVQGLTAPAGSAPGPVAHRRGGRWGWVLLLVLFGALFTSGGGEFRMPGVGPGTNLGVRVVSIAGRSEQHVTGSSLRDGEVFTAMGRSTVDLRDVTLPAGATATIDGLTMMGSTVIRVPETWAVDVTAIAAFGRVRDERQKPADPSAPRLEVRGAVLFGTLIVTSDNWQAS